LCNTELGRGGKGVRVKPVCGVRVDRKGERMRVLDHAAATRADIETATLRLVAIRQADSTARAAAPGSGCLTWR
jgi:hypothetical protein